MNRQTIKSVDLAAQVFGTSGSPIVILHGLYGSGRNWTTIAKRLSEDHRVATLDLRNHGSSPWADEMTYDHLAADVRAFIEGEALGPVTLIGHSMGGKAAMRLALTSPSLIDRLVVADIAPIDYDHSTGAYIDVMRRLNVGDLSSRGEIDERLAASVPDAMVRAFLMQNLLRTDGDGYAWRLNLEALAVAMPALMTFPRDGEMPFEKPTLFLAGAHSDYIKAVHERGILELFPKAEIETIPDAGHWLHAQQPEFFLESLGRFLGAQ